jgi:hypothetical protein
MLVLIIIYVITKLKNQITGVMELHQGTVESWRRGVVELYNQEPWSFKVK